MATTCPNPKKLSRLCHQLPPRSVQTHPSFGLNHKLPQLLCPYPLPIQTSSRSPTIKSSTTPLLSDPNRLNQKEPARGCAKYAITRRTLVLVVSSINYPRVAT